MRTPLPTVHDAAGQPADTGVTQALHGRGELPATKQGAALGGTWLAAQDRRRRGRDGLLFGVVLVMAPRQRRGRLFLCPHEVIKGRPYATMRRLVASLNLGDHIRKPGQGRSQIGENVTHLILRHPLKLNESCGPSRLPRDSAHLLLPPRHHLLPNQRDLNAAQWAREMHIKIHAVLGVTHRRSSPRAQSD